MHCESLMCLSHAEKAGTVHEMQQVHQDNIAFLSRVWAERVPVSCVALLQNAWLSEWGGLEEYSPPVWKRGWERNGPFQSAWGMVSAYSEGSFLFVRVLPAACCNNRRAVPYKSLELASVHISQWLGQRTQGSGKQPNFSARLQQYRGCAWEMGLLFNCESNDRLIEERRKEVQFRGVEESYWSCFSKCWCF